LTPHSATTGPNGESALFQWEAGPAAGIAWPSLYFTYYGQEYLITTRNGMVIGHTFDDMPYLGDGDGFVRIGETSRHPINHYGENWFLDRLRQLASEYRARWGLTLAYNDISLRRGGVFDLNGNFSGPHNLHRQGHDADVRANTAQYAIPHDPEVRGWFEERVQQLFGRTPLLESAGTSNEHYHIFGS
jgi:hypothetical protein